MYIKLKSLLCFDEEYKVRSCILIYKYINMAHINYKKKKSLSLRCVDCVPLDDFFLSIKDIGKSALKIFGSFCVSVLLQLEEVYYFRGTKRLLKLLFILFNITYKC